MTIFETRAAILTLNNQINRMPEGDDKEALITARNVLRELAMVLAAVEEMATRYAAHQGEYGGTGIAIELRNILKGET